MLISGCGVSGIGALHRQAVASEGIRGFCGDKIFENLAARLLLWLGQGHAHSIFTPAPNAKFPRGLTLRMKRSIEKLKPATEMELPGHPVRASRTEMTELVLPQDSNLLGDILGGRVMHLIDIAGAIAAQRHCHRQVVTVSVDHLDFLNPVRVGDLIVLEAHVNRAFRTSVEVGVEVFSEDAAAGVRNRTTKAFLTFVALDEAGRPVPVPPLIVKTSEERRRFREAGERRNLRLKTRKK